eukprot:maker-scaffold_104-snap-gene-0.21-mRNA-1 protein AED:0.67 eAED:0.70 QI:0/0/0/1/1/1/2/0/983
MSKKDFSDLFEKLTQVLDAVQVSQEALRGVKQPILPEETDPNFDVDPLKELEPKKIDQMITQLRRLSSRQQKRINLKQKLDLVLFEHFEQLDKAKSNDDIIAHLKVLRDEARKQDLGAPDRMIAENIDFQVGMREEDAVAIMYTKVKELLALMPESCAKSKKKIALAILKKLPKYFWVSSEDLVFKPELLDLDHENLQNYVLQCIPPPRVRKVIKKGLPFVNDLHEKRSKKISACTLYPTIPVKPTFNKPKSDEPCSFCHNYGHPEKKCFIKKNAKRDGKDVSSPLPRPAKDIMEKRRIEFRERRAEQQKSKLKNKEKSPEDATVRKEVETNFVDVDLSMAEPSVLPTVRWKCDAEMSLRCKGEEILVDGMLDSGVGITAAPRWLVEKMCERIFPVEEPTHVKVANVCFHEVLLVGVIRPTVVIDGVGRYDLGPVKCLLVEGVKLWSKLLIGLDVLERHGISPMQMLVDRIKTKQTTPIEVNATQLETKKSTRELSDWFISSFTSSKNKIQQDLDIQIMEAEMAQSEEEPYVMKGRVLFTDKAVTFEPQEDAFVDDDLDIGGNLDVKVEEDVARLRGTLQNKVNQNKDKYPGDQWKEKFLKLFLDNAEAFRDDLSPTRISTLKPIKRTLIPNADVGVRKSRPMGPEKEDFLRLRIDKMLKNKVIAPNRNTIHSMMSLVVPKAGPRKYMFVVDFRPLNVMTKNIDSTLPNIESQLRKARGSAICLQIKNQPLFTFNTPWDLCYKFLGAPQGWCNTPSFFSERIIREILKPQKLFLTKVLQWIDNTVLLGNTIQESYDNTRKFLGVKHKKLRLNIDKCRFISDSTVFCGHKLTQKGYTLDDCYAKDLLSRKRPQYTYELAQMIFAANWIAGVLPGFSEVRTLITTDNKISWKIKLLERKKIPIKWTDTFKNAYKRFIELLEDSLHTTLGYYDSGKDVVIFVDSSERFWSYYLCQSDEEIQFKNSILTSFHVIAMSSGSFKGSQLK